nr:hypothetical protein [Desulfobacteraceae bacterium]
MNMSSEHEFGKSVVCRYCQDEMERMTVKTFPGNWPLGIMIVGLICCFLVIGPLVGIPLLIVGIYMLLAENPINFCPSCGHYYKILNVDRMDFK